MAKVGDVVQYDAGGGDDGDTSLLAFVTKVDEGNNVNILWFDAATGQPHVANNVPENLNGGGVTYKPLA